MNKTRMFAVIATTLMTVASISAEARSFSRQGSYVTGRGASGTYSSVVTRSPGQVSRSGSITTSKGNTYNRSAVTTYNSATGTVDHSVTGPGGKTRSVVLTPQ